MQPFISLFLPKYVPLCYVTQMATDFLYQQHQQFFGLISEGLIPWGAEELRAAGAERIEPGYRGIHFQATPAVLYHQLYTTRLFSRILAPLFSFDCHSSKYLYRRAAAIDWPALFTPEMTFAIDAVTSHSAIRHSRYAALTLKDAIVDRFREDTGTRPSVSVRNPSIRFHLYIQQNRATISMDLAGSSLHRRGYRVASVEAPMTETIAAGLLAASDWDGQTPLVDPFCGSGTILCEAWMRACVIPAGYLRAYWGLTALPDFDKTLWRQVRERADGKIHCSATTVRGSDIDPESIQATRTNLAQLPYGDRVKVDVKDARALMVPADTWIVTNPPYGVRFGQPETAQDTLKAFGDTLKQQCAGASAFIYYGAPALLKRLGLKPFQRIPIAHGGLEGMLGCYRLFAGPADQQPRQASSHTQPGPQ